MRYLIVETHTAYSIALGSDGRFMNVLNQNHAEGQYVNDVIPIETGRRKEIPVKRITAFASIAACLLIVFLASTLYMPDAYAKVYITVNPEIALDVSEKGKVVGLEALNPDGEKIIEGIKWRKRDALTVTDEIMDKGIALGLIKKSSVVRLDIDTDDDAWFGDMGLKFRTNLDQYLKGKVDAPVKIHRYSEKEQKAIEKKEKKKKETTNKKETTKKSGTPSNSNYSDGGNNKDSTKNKNKDSGGSSGGGNNNSGGGGSGDDSSYDDNSSYEDDSEDDSGYEEEDDDD